MHAVDGIDPAELGKALGIPVRQERTVEALPAPLSWPVEKRSVTNRELAATWSWDRGLFRMDTAQEECTVRLERYRRARGDDRDVFLVVLPGHAAKAFTARTSAILEAHRLAERVLFTFDGILLRRVTRDGCLPDPIARMLRLTLRSTQRRLGRLTHRRYRGRPRASWAPRGTAAWGAVSGVPRD